MLTEHIVSFDDLTWLIQNLDDEKVELVQATGVQSIPCFFHQIPAVTEGLKDVRILRSTIHPVGRVGFVQYSDREASDTQCTLLWIHPDRRGRGYGTHFLRLLHYRTLCGGGNLRRVSVNAENVDFYEGLGYVISPENLKDSANEPVSMCAVLSAKRYIIKDGSLIMTHCSGETFIKSRDKAVLHGILSATLKSTDLTLSEGGIEWHENGAQLRFPPDNTDQQYFEIWDFLLHDLIKVTSILQTKGWAVTPLFHSMRWEIVDES